MKRPNTPLCGVGVISTAQHSGKSTCADLLAELLGARRWETSLVIRLEFDRLHDTNTVNDEAERLRCHEEIGQHADQRRETDPVFTVSGIPVDVPAIASGMRHPAEADYLRDRGFWIVKVATTDATDRARLTPGEYARHKIAGREQAMPRYPAHIVVRNNRSLREFRRQVRRAARIIAKHGQPPDWWTTAWLGATEYKP